MRPAAMKPQLAVLTDQVCGLLVNYLGKHKKKDGFQGFRVFVGHFPITV